ncbi:MAG: NIL domain-containing protein [Chlorogloeopsis fritschii C42_A2020_084]|uniref:NIL domain-containing protein n=1 Tax=Chlorogloeopsis fritschii TaxID=1124 RepID=UPI0019D95289|nr:NIL domain-containing protein [Chlorogloeopsis fritschii]MBF2007311.1 NIL domain-containing protein [Chlorogloeopsis fritschii C42_A2020_084]
MTNFKSAKIAPIHTRIRVPQHYYRQPVISRLISRYNLTVNIKAASLAAGEKHCGWFDLELQGKPEQVVNSLSYLQGLGVDLMQVAIAGSIQPNQDSYSFPISDSNLATGEPTAITSEWGTQIYPQISNNQTNRLRLQLCISKNHYHKPVISELVSSYGVTVNITGALLKPDVQDDGWFDIELWGRSEQLFSSWSYLQNFL